MQRVDLGRIREIVLQYSPMGSPIFTWRGNTTVGATSIGKRGFRACGVELGKISFVFSGMTSPTECARKCTSDMMDRIGMRGSMASKYLWKEPSGEQPDWRA